MKALISLRECESYHFSKIIYAFEMVHSEIAHAHSLTLGSMVVNNFWGRGEELHSFGCDEISETLRSAHAQRRICKRAAKIG